MNFQKNSERGGIISDPTKFHCKFGADRNGNFGHELPKKMQYNFSKKGADLCVHYLFVLCLPGTVVDCPTLGALFGGQGRT